MMTQQQIRWAETHDWFVADLGDGMIWVVDRYSDGSAGYMWMNDFRALRRWAGY